VVNLRPRLGPPFTHPDYLGSCVLSAKPSYITASPLPSPDTLIPILEHALTTSLSAFDGLAIQTRLATLIRVPGTIDNQDLNFANGNNVYITD
jgi:hypothetical protein